MSKTIAWEKVTFVERSSPACDLTFRPSGQIVFGPATLSALGYPRFVHLFSSAANHLIALKASDNSEGDALQLAVVELPRDEPRTISGRRVYRWLLGQLGQEDVLIKLTGALNDEGMVVFDLKKAAIVPRRARKTRETGMSQ